MSFADSNGGKNAQPGTVYRQTGLGEHPPKGISGFGELIFVVADNLKLLVLGPLFAALVAFGIAGMLPKQYTSVAYLALDETGARVADARMRSAPVLDKVLAEFHPPRDTLEARRRFLDRNMRMIVAAGETQKTSGLFRLEYSDTDPKTAQKVNALLLEAWLASTQPPPNKRAEIQGEIERAELQIKSISQLIDRLQKDAPSLVAQSLQGELATPILGLIAKRDQNLANIVNLKNLLNGISRDVIFGSPDLPEEPSWPGKGIAVLITGFVTGLLLLMFVVLRHLAGPNMASAFSSKWSFRRGGRGRAGG